MKRKLCLLILTILLVTMVSNAEEFNWKKFQGQTIKVMFNQHPYADGIIKKIPEFEQATGIKVNYSIIPEENYFDKLTVALSSKSGDPDVFMTGAYQIWEYAPPNFVVDLDKFLQDKQKTALDYDYEDFFPTIVGALRWDKVPGHKVGSGSLWALPIGFESNCITYNKELFDKNNLKPPATINEMVETAKKLNEFGGKGTYGIAVRGTRNWATIHPGYMTTYTNYGAVDLAIEDGKLVSKVNSKEAVAMTEMWVNMIREAGSPTWASYTWYQCGADLGAGKAAMMFDADVLGYFNNVEGASSQAGNLASAPPPVLTVGKDVKANLWVWALAINNASKVQDASWYFIQYFTNKEFQTFSVLDWKSVDTPRKSVFNNPKFQKKIGQMEGFAKTFEQIINGTTICFTPNPYFFELTTEWAATLQDLVAGNKYSSVKEGMDALKAKMDEALEDIDLD